MWHRLAAWWRGWRYHWSPVTRLEPVRVGEGDPRFGSMQLDDDDEARWLEAWPRCIADEAAGPYDGGPDWREQMVAELSPEALEPRQPVIACAVNHHGRPCPGYPDHEHPQGPQAAVSWGADPGPGAGSSSAPGPGGVLGEREPPACRIPTPERLCGPGQPHEKPAGTESAGSGHRPLSVALPGPGVGDGIEWAVNAAISPHTERLADTGEIASARQLAEWDADLRAQDDDAARYLAGLGFECERYRLEMAEALA